MGACVLGETLTCLTELNLFGLDQWTTCVWRTDQTAGSLLHVKSDPLFTAILTIPLMIVGLVSIIKHLQ